MFASIGGRRCMSTIKRKKVRMAVSIRAGGICSVTIFNTNNRIYSIFALVFFNEHFLLSAMPTVDQICLFFSFRLNTRWIIDEQNKRKKKSKWVRAAYWNFPIKSIFALHYKAFWAIRIKTKENKNEKKKINEEIDLSTKIVREPHVWDLPQPKVQTQTHTHTQFNFLFMTLLCSIKWKKKITDQRSIVRCECCWYST